QFFVRLRVRGIWERFVQYLSVGHRTELQKLGGTENDDAAQRIALNLHAPPASSACQAPGRIGIHVPTSASNGRIRFSRRSNQRLISACAMGWGVGILAATRQRRPNGHHFFSTLATPKPSR